VDALAGWLIWSAARQEAPRPEPPPRRLLAHPFSLGREMAYLWLPVPLRAPEAERIAARVRSLVIEPEAG
jgi:hypothetical protein